jgi:hypothetical protein
MRAIAVLVASLGAWSLAVLTAAVAAAEVPSYVLPAHASALGPWMSSHSHLRVATDEDCQCAEEVEDLRRGTGGKWAANPGFHPYYAAGDFNGDGHQDFAVVLVDKANPKSRRVVVFNGPFSTQRSKGPAYVSSKYVGALFFGPPRPKPWRLVIGPFETEGAILEPRGTSYVLKQGSC